MGRCLPRSELSGLPVACWGCGGGSWPVQDSHVARLGSVQLHSAFQFSVCTIGDGILVRTVKL